MSEPKLPPSLDDIGARLKAAREAAADKALAEHKKRGDAQGLGLGMRIGIELVVAVLAGGGIGLLIDRWLNTTPIFMLAFLALGFAAGVLNVLRLTRGMDEAVGLGRAAREQEAREKEEQDAGQNGPAGENKE